MTKDDVISCNFCAKPAKELSIIVWADRDNAICAECILLALNQVTDRIKMLAGAVQGFNSLAKPAPQLPETPLDETPKAGA